jgi:hypothetical protein
MRNRWKTTNGRRMMNCPRMSTRSRRRSCPNCRMTDYPTEAGHQRMLILTPIGCHWAAGHLPIESRTRDHCCRLLNGSRCPLKSRRIANGHHPIERLTWSCSLPRNGCRPTMNGRYRTMSGCRTQSHLESYCCCLENCCPRNGCRRTSRNCRTESSPENCHWRRNYHRLAPAGASMTRIRTRVNWSRRRLNLRIGSRPS